MRQTKIHQEEKIILGTAFLGTRSQSLSLADIKFYCSQLVHFPVMIKSRTMVPGEVSLYSAICNRILILKMNMKKTVKVGGNIVSSVSVVGPEICSRRGGR